MTYERVVVTVKTSGPTPGHPIVEVAWWNLNTGQRGCFIPPHNRNHVLGNCDIDAIETIGYLPRIARAPQDKTGAQAHALATTLDQAVLVTTDPFGLPRRLATMFNDYPDNVQYDVFEPQWHHVLDAQSYAAGVLGLGILPDLATICEYTGVPSEAAHTADTDTDALGRAVLRLAELADAAKHWQAIPSHVPAQEELTAALAARINRVAFQAVTFTYHPGEETPTYTVNTDVVGREAHEVYGPVILGLMGEVERSTQQLNEMAANTLAAANQYQARLTELQTLPLDPAMHAMVKTAVDTAPDGEAAATEVLKHVRNWTAAKDSIINGLYERVQELDDEVARVQASRQAWAIEAMDTELSVDGPWEQLVKVPSTELSVGPETAEPPAERPGQVVDIPDHLVPKAVEPADVPPPCPAPEDCGHPLAAHQHQGHYDPIPTCTGGPDAIDCDCGRMAPGWRRADPLQVWHPGDTIPPRVTVFGADGQVYVTNDDPWCNDTGVTVVEIELHPVERALATDVDEVPLGAEVAG